MRQARRHARAALLALALPAGLVATLAWGPTRAAASPLLVATAADDPQEGVRPPREIRVVARKYSFSPQRIEVQENDLVKITMETADIPHSFTIDDDNYRIAKRATPGHPAVFEFRADKAGTFTFYCNLAADSGCRGMKGELVVKPKR